MIFDLFRAKPTLKELIPDGFVDIHSHIIPGIDDGAKTIKESSQIIAGLENLGFSKIYFTPHTFPGLYDNTKEKILEGYNSMNKLTTDVQLSCASEYLIDDYLFDLIKEKKILTLKDNYLLLEMSYIAPPINLHEILFELIQENYKPIIAHPERYLFFEGKFKMYEKLKNIGCLFQINMLSSTGYYGKYPTKTLNRLLTNDFVDFVGTDIHNVNQLNEFNSKIKIQEEEIFLKSMEKNIFFK